LLSYFIPLLAAFIISFKLHIYVAGRYDILVFPVFCLVMAVGLNRIAPGFLRWLLLTIVVVSTAVSLQGYYFVYNKSNDRLISNYVQAQMSQEDVIVATELSITPFEYYWARGFQPKLFQFPQGPRGFLTRKALEGEEEYVNMEIDRLISQVYLLLKENTRLWLLYQPAIFSQKLFDRLNRDLEVIGNVNFAPGDNLNQAEKVYIFRKKK
jgi:hypothetical protein